ncbi:MAG: hypothetical protein ACK5NB_07320 [Flavobacteriaceae bacterium]
MNIDRLYKCLKQDLKLNLKKYLMAILVLAVVLFVVDIYMINDDSRFISNTENSKTIKDFAYWPLFFVSSVAFLVLVSGISFPELRNKKSTAHYLLIPASALEKTMVQFLIRIVLAPVIFLLVYWATYKLAIYAYVSFSPFNFVNVPSYGLFEVLPPDADTTMLDNAVILLSYLSLACLFFAGSTYFKKYAMLKTIIAFGVLCGLVLLCFVLLSHVFLPGAVKGLDIEVHVRDVFKGKLITLQLLVYVIGAFSGLFFLPLAYFNLKEKEV